MSLIKIYRLQHTNTSPKQPYRVNDRSLAERVTPAYLFREHAKAQFAARSLTRLPWSYVNRRITRPCKLEIAEGRGVQGGGGEEGHPSPPLLGYHLSGG